MAKQRLAATPEPVQIADGPPPRSDRGRDGGSKAAE